MAASSSERAPLLDGEVEDQRASTEQSLRSSRPEPSSRTPTPASSYNTQSATAAGVARIDSVSAQITNTERGWLFFCILLMGYAYGLESQVRSTYQPYATASFSLHSYLATINVLRSVVAVAVQPTAAKVADICGRFEILVASSVIYVLGMAIESTAMSVYTFCLGGVIYQIGYTAIVLLLEILVADFSSMRARVFFSYLPALPFVFNTWLSGNVTAAVLRVASWRWGIGMWCFIFPVASLPLLTTLYTIERRTLSKAAKKSKSRGDVLELEALRRQSVEFLQQVDAVGLLILVSAFSLILAPLTYAGGVVSHWRNPGIVVPLVLGILCIPGFVLWEKRKASTPLVPFHLLTDRGVWAALAVRSFLNLAWYIQGTYLYTLLVVGFDFPIETATRILSFFSFFGVFSGVAVGLIVYRLRRLKYIIVSGTVLFSFAFVLLIVNPGGATDNSRIGMISAQVLLGLAGGLFAYPTQASIQASASRDHVAIVTGLYLSFYNIGSALGTCVSGAIWTQNLYQVLRTNLAFQSDRHLAENMYNNPFDTVKGYPVGTEIRNAIIHSYAHVQTLLCVAGLVVCLPMIGFALALRNPRLSSQQVQVQEATREDDATIA